MQAYGPPRFPPGIQVPYQPKPARLSWSAKQGETVTKTLACGRDLTNLEAAILYVYAGGPPTSVACLISDPSAGMVTVEYDTSNTPVGEWRWTLFLMAPAQPVPAYTGTIKVEPSDAAT